MPPNSSSPHVLSACQAIVARCARSEVSPEVAVMELLIASEDAHVVEQVVGAEALATDGGPLARLRDVWTENRAQCGRLAELLRAQELPLQPDASLTARLEHCRRLFDALVKHSEEASVALYSLGNPEILAAATREIVALLRRLSLLSEDTRALDIGCGIGRMETALAPHLAHIHGIDLAGEMVATAQRRCAKLENVQISLCSGRDLAGVASGSKQLVLAVDSFPYVFQAGPELVNSLFAEAFRVLAPGGYFVIFNFSYRDDLARDCAEVAELAAQHGFSAKALGERPFQLWNGALFLLQRGGTS
jgi:cyclopropane fatty-acyl-phospholipid synthase-like methyltransferase